MKVTKLLRRSTCLFLALVMLFSYPAGVYSEGTGTNPSEAPEIPEGYVWRTLSVELAPFEEEQKEKEEEEAARWEQKAEEAAHFLELMFSRSVELDEEADEPSIEVRGWMPEDVTARAELLSYAEEDLYKELTLMQVELRFYDGEGQPWQPTEPVTVCIEGDMLEDARAAKMDPTVYVYVEEPRKDNKPNEQVFSVEAFSAARTGDEEKTYERELGEDVHAEVVERALKKIEEAPKAVCFETGAEALRFVVTARQSDRTYTAASENGLTELVVVGALPRGLSASVAPAPVRANSDVLPGEVVLAWDLALIHPEVPAYEADTTVKVALRDKDLANLKSEDWDLQLWQLRQDADPVRVKDAAFQGENLRFSADTLSTFVVVQVPVERHLNATDGKTYSVKVSYDSRAGIPANAELEVRELLPEEKGYDGYLAQSAQRIGCEVADLEFARLFDITLRDPETGAEYQPNRNVKVSIELMSENLAECAEVDVLHFGEETEVMGSYVKGDAVAFETSGFSVYVVMGVSLATTITAGDGSTYEVTVSYDRSAGIPIDAELQVRELTGEEYDEYLTKTAEFLSRDEEQLVYTRLFDITIVKDGVVYEPNKAVDVSIRLVDRPETQGVLRVVHFGEEKTELLENEVAEDGCLQFVTSSFSVYAITDEDGKVLVPRAYYYFYRQQGDPTPTSRQIIKNGGILAEVDYNVSESQAFMGWYIWENGDWGEEVPIGSPIQVMFGKEEARYGDCAVVRHVDDNDTTNYIEIHVKPRYTTNFAVINFRDNVGDTTSKATVDTKTLPMEGVDSLTYELPDASTSSYDFYQTPPQATASEPGFIFVGWSTDAPKTKTSDGKYDFFNKKDTRTPITSVTVTKTSKNVTLFPVFKQAYWLTFKTGPEGSSAERIRSAYVLYNETPRSKKPADPTWREHKFLDWTKENTFDDEIGETLTLDHTPESFNWDVKLTENTTIYVYWEDGFTTYTVIYWKQSASADKNKYNTPPQERTYEFDSQVTRNAMIKTPVTLEYSDTHKNWEGFHHKDERVGGDENVDTLEATVKSGGTTVLNVYYDRDVMTMRFYGAYDQTPVNPAPRYNSSVWYDTTKTLVLQGLFGQSLADYDYQWPSGIWTYYNVPSTGATKGMSYLGEFVFPEEELKQNKEFRAYKTGVSRNVELFFYRQNANGSWPDLANASDKGGFTINDNGTLTFTFSEKYDGFNVCGYRRFYTEYVNGDTIRRYVDKDNNTISAADPEMIPAKNGDSVTLKKITVNTPVYQESWYYTIGSGTNAERVYVDEIYSGTVQQEYSGQQVDGAICYCSGSIGSELTYDISWQQGGNGWSGYYYYYNKLVNVHAKGTQGYQANAKQYAKVELNGLEAYVPVSKQSAGSTAKQSKMLHLEVYYARRNYVINYYDSMDGKELMTLTQNGHVGRYSDRINYEDVLQTEHDGVVEGWYPDPEFIPTAKERGYNFNGRWYADKSCTTQVFFHTDGSTRPTVEEEKLLWYYVENDSDEKIYIGSIASPAEQGMTLEQDGRKYDKDEAVCYCKMPNRDLALYAGFTHTWYWIKIDPNGGYLNNNDPRATKDTTYLWRQYGKRLTEYDTKRNFVQDDEFGTWYYHYDEFKEKDADIADHLPGKAYYSQNQKDSTDGGKKYRRIEEPEDPEEEADEGYTFIAWYLVNKDENTGEETLERFNFQESYVTGNMILRAMWQQRGNYRVYYSKAKALDTNGNEITTVTVGGTAPVDDFKYANESAIPILGDENNVMEAHNKNSSDKTKYNFVGWYFDNKVYATGDVFFANSLLAEKSPEPFPGEEDLYNTFVLYPVFRDAGDGNDNAAKTSLVLDANGGAWNDLYTKSLPSNAYLKDNNKVYYSEESGGQTMSLNMDALLPLPTDDENHQNIFVKEKCEFLGWAFSKDAKAAKFKPGQLVGVDNDDGSGFNGQNGNVLYAVWHRTEIPIRVKLVDDKTNKEISGGEFTLKNEKNEYVPGAEGTLVSNSDGLLAKGSVTDFDVLTPENNSYLTYYNITETLNASGYISLQEPVRISVEYDGTIKVANGASFAQTFRQGDVYVIRITQRQAICKVVNGGNETLFGTLNDAVAYDKTLNGESRIEMLDDYEMPKSDFVTIEAGNNILLTTASKDSRNPYRGTGTTATITRAESGTSLFTMNGGSFDMTNIILDGGSTSNKACVNDGGIVRVNNGSLTVSSGTLLRNSSVNSNTKEDSHGGAISATGAGASVKIRGQGNSPVRIENCTAKHCGGGVSVADGAILLVDNASFSGCTANAVNQTGVYGGGAIAVRNGGNDPADPDVQIFGAKFENCGTKGIGGAVLVSNAAVEIEDSVFGKDDGTNGNDANNGGAICARNEANLLLFSTGIYGSSAKENGGAVYVNHSNVTLSETSINRNTAATGAGVYVSAGSKLKISGELDFGGTGVNTDGSIDNNAGNHATGTLVDSTNGSTEYTKARQDIYLAEAAPDPASLVITGNLDGENGSIWVWAEHDTHYMTSKPFAVIDSDETIDANTYSVFRNAQVDAKTLCTGDYLTGKSGERSFIYWTGGRNVAFLKIDGDGQPLADAIFGVYVDQDCEVPVNRKNDRLVAVSDADGVTTFENLSPNVYFMKETQAPEHCELSETKYVILVGAENLLIPEEREGDWAGVLSDLTQAEIDAEVEKNLELFELPEYAIFMIDKTTGKAVTTRSIAEQGIMNMSDAVWPVILSKINTKLERLPGAHFTIRSIDGTVYAQGEVEEFESDDSGVFFAGRLPLGTYYLEETVELKVGETEYVKPTHYFVFQVSKNGVKALKKNDEGEYEFAASNTVVEPEGEEYEIPATTSP